MAIHDKGNYGIVTDGGAHGSCFSNAYKYVKQYIDGLKPQWLMGKWAWVISHLDYDHFSIIIKMAEEQIVKPPKVVVLPLSYAYRECKEMHAHYLALAEAITYVLKLRPPASYEIFDLLRKLQAQGRRVIYVRSGSILHTKRAVYYFVWPDDRYVLERCTALRERLSEKIKAWCKKAEDPNEREQKANNVFEEATRAFSELQGVQSDKLDLAKLLEDDEGVYDEEKMPRRVENIIGVQSVYEILAQAGELALARDVINATSLAYVMSTKNAHYCHIDLFNDFGYLHCHSFCHYRPWHNGCVLYLGDLTGGELCRALENAEKIGVCEVCVTVAAHHGNADLNCPLPATGFMYISRCDYHVPQSYKQGLRLEWLLKAPSIISGHEHGAVTHID